MSKLDRIMYIVTGVVTFVAALLVIPWFDTLRYPGTTYAEGFNAFNTVLALCAGVGLAFSLYRADRRKNSSNGGE